MTQKDDSVVDYLKQKSKSKSLIKKISFTLAIVIFLGIISFFIFKLLSSNSNSSKPLVSVDVCTKPANINLLKISSNDIYASNINQLATVVRKIQSLPSDEKSANCLYPIVWYYINTSNLSDSSKYLNDLKKVYNNKVGYNPILHFTVSLKILEADVANIKKDNLYISNNALSMPVPANIRNSK